MGVAMPYKFSAYDRRRGFVLDNWVGSLLEGAQDKSGLQFKRNRYYDPQTGRFTQEDPLGLAGGLNLYGFAGGDPVNFSDPFGLQGCPKVGPPPPECEALQHPLIDPVAIAAGGLAGAAEGLLAGGGEAALESASGEAVSEGLAARATAIQEALPEATQGFTTTAAARVTTAEGGSRVLVASSEQVLRPAQRAALAAGEIAVAGRGHAEITILNAARQLGAVVDAIAVSRPICPACAQALRQAGVDILTVLK